LEYEVLASGCCGMAGAFGFERGDHYDVSIKAGERVLLPVVRAAAPETLIVADGFSCREQIAQTTDRRALHLAQLLQMALHGASDGSAGAYPESAYTNAEERPEPAFIARKAAIAAGVLAGGALAWRVGKRRVG
jgi:hypothetical protein